MMCVLDNRFHLKLVVSGDSISFSNVLTTARFRPSSLLHGASLSNSSNMGDDSFNWPFACVQREEFHHHWCNTKESMDHFVLKEAHYATVDCVHLIQV
ncbi:hypothetical protein HOLleu_13956 [Holothuria leucospilota]|uniref:Uncharacterized protein n=1 Tax=Holothuria leucospilota TaxID=206669 RepID=A0A9Q1C8E1_HOLLE|nr:hypothetical protein HOLleu_13956 [Holothuria leucospilota]